MLLRTLILLLLLLTLCCLAGCGGGSKEEVVSKVGGPMVLTLNRLDTASAGQARLYLTVVDSSTDAPAAGLKAANFTFQVNGAPAMPTVLTQQQTNIAPLSTALVLDRTAGMAGAKLTAMKAAAVDLVSHLRTQDEVEVVSFGLTGGMTVEQGFTSSKTSLITAINAITADSSSSPFFDAIAKAGLDTSLRPAGNNKAVVALTDGGESSSTYTTVTALGNYLKTLNIPIYTIGLGINHDITRDRPLYYEDEDNLVSIAFKTDGEYFYIADSTALLGTYQRILTRLQQQYIITLPVTGALTSLTVHTAADGYAGELAYP